MEKQSEIIGFKKKGGGALRRLWEKYFEAIFLVLKIGLGGYFFLFESF